MGWQDDPLVAGKPKWESDPIVTASLAVSPQSVAGPMIDIRPGVPAPLLIAPSANPYSAGRYPNNRVYTVGDERIFLNSDLLTRVEKNTRTRRVIRVDIEADRVEMDHGNLIDLMGNNLTDGKTVFDVPRQWNPSEFYVGKKWTAAFSGTEPNGFTWNTTHYMQIVKREIITVPAGTFDTFRIEGIGWNYTLGIRAEMTRWLVPGLIATVKQEQLRRGNKGEYIQADRQELVAVRQQVFDTACVSLSEERQRSLAIRSNCTG